MIPKIFSREKIKRALETLDPLPLIEEGFVGFSQGKVVVPPVGELIFDHPPGDVHIKYGYIVGDVYYVVKIASGFYENARYNIPTGSGLMLLFKQKTGELECILLDEGYLTHVRTAIAGAIVAKYLAPAHICCIGIIGTGIQGRMQLEYLKSIIRCQDVLIWGRDEPKLVSYKNDMAYSGFNIKTTLDIDEIPARCNFIVTATPSKIPLLHSDQIHKGMHITAVGADTPQKNELEPGILQKADIVVADSIAQCLSRGEIFQAIKAGVLKKKDLVELGNVILNRKLRRTSDDQISVADLTGVAVQDIQIAKAVAQVLSSNKTE